MFRKINYNYTIYGIYSILLIQISNTAFSKLLKMRQKILLKVFKNNSYKFTSIYEYSNECVFR